jgi:prepilin-type N-terminal cleavage/methylation domain-containing protein
MTRTIFAKQNLNGQAHGFTLMEILGVVAVMTILMTIVLTSFTTLNKNQALDKTAKYVASIIEEARGNTLFSKNDAQYGIKFASSSVTLFKGATYSAGSSDNVVYELNPLVSISNISLSGGGSEMVFDRLTGNTTQTGTITLSLNSSTTTRVYVSFSKTGIVEVTK